MNLDKKIGEAYKAISAINKEAYKDIFLLSNCVLSKNPFTNNFLKRFLSGEKPKLHLLSIIFLKLLRYYLASLVYLLLYVFHFVQYLLCGPKFNPLKNRKELIIIDTFFLMQKIVQVNSYKDPYFQGLEDLLKKMGKHYVYLPMFHSPYSNYAKALSLYKTLRILKRDKVSVLTEYQLLSFNDLMYIIYFIVTYPFHVFKFISTLQTNRYEEYLLKYELLDTISQATFHSFSRYLQGRKIAALPYDKIKVISWYENQVIDKNLYKGLRVDTNKTKIYGAQLFLYAKSFISIIPDDNEQSFGILPDKIIVNGTYYIPQKTRLNFAVGPSFRYSKIFSTKIYREKQKNILVLLPYFINEAKNIILLLQDLEPDSQNFIIKPHPGADIEQLRQLIPSHMEVTHRDTYELLEISKIVISAASGTLIEATSLGIPVIVVTNKDGLDYKPLPEYGKGIIWAEASTSIELEQQIDILKKRVEENLTEIICIAQKYKQTFFCEPTKEIIIKAFDLDTYKGETTYDYNKGNIKQ